MGMFDELTCEYPLPDPIVQDELFQTKSLDCVLEHYTITRDGRLIHHRVRYEDVPETERPYYGTPEWEENSILQLAGSIKAIPAGDVEIPFHGYLRFYTYLGKYPEGEDFTYLAKFTNGRVEEIKRVDQNAETPVFVPEGEGLFREGVTLPAEVFLTYVETQAIPITDRVTFEVSFDPADREEGFLDDIRFTIHEKASAGVRLFAADTTSILLTVAQAEALATALLQAANNSRNTPR